MKKEYLTISEKFYSIQGEGPTTGCPSIFVRLAGCNILCKGKGWVCDSIEVWKKGVKTNFEDIFSKGEITSLRQGTHLIFTGGEPLLYQETIKDFLNWFNDMYGFYPFTEIETNGTIEPKELSGYIDQWNVSPKLTNSGVSEEKRINPIALAKFDEMPEVVFKFVIATEEDAREVAELYLPLKREKIIFMPAGATQDELLKTRPIVVEMCKAYGYRYSERLHIVIWNKKTGV